MTLEFGNLFPGGIGAATVAIPAFGACGGYALAGRRAWIRVVASIPPLSGTVAWALTATGVGGPALALDTARGLWVSVHFWSLLAVLALGCSIPLRISAGAQLAAPRGQREQQRT